MSHRFSLLCIAIFMLAVPATQAQSDNAEMEAWMTAMQPGENHEYLASFEGDWSVTTTMWEQAGVPPVESTGTATSKMVMGGRYLEGHYQGVMMDMPFEGRSIAAYDNVAGEFVYSWIDTFGTGISVYRGSREDNTITTSTQMMNPVTGKMETHRIVETRISDDEYTMDYFVTPPEGDEFKAMHNVYKRSK